MPSPFNCETGSEIRFGFPAYPRVILSVSSPFGIASNACFGIGMDDTPILHRDPPVTGENTVR